MTGTKQLPKKKTPPKGYLSLSQISLRTGLDGSTPVYRETCRNRLEAAGYEPHPDSTDREKFYKWDEQAEAIVKQTNNPYTKARIDITEVKTKREQLKLQQETGELIPRKDVVSETVLLFSALQKKIAVQGIKELVKDVRKVKTAAEAEDFARAFLNKPFMDAREDYPKFLEENK